MEGENSKVKWVAGGKAGEEDGEAEELGGVTETLMLGELWAVLRVASRPPPLNYLWCPQPPPLRCPLHPQL